MLPGVLPSGYQRAAPFRGTGSGAALPNPQVWSSGYALTYTDGSGRLTLVVNPDGDPAVGPWRTVEATVDDRALQIQERDALVVVRTAPTVVHRSLSSASGRASPTRRCFKWRGRCVRCSLPGVADVRSLP